MDDYLMKFGFSPQEMGLDRFMQPEKAAETAARPSRNKDAVRKPLEEAAPAGRENGFDNEMLKDLPLTMAYVPFQRLKETYNEQEALKSGTLFPELDKPFLGRRP